MNIYGYMESGAISATIDGILMTVPDDPANRHRQMIAEWEAEGNTIPAYVPPPVNPFTPLQPYQFWTAVRATNHEADLLTWVANLQNPLEKASASSMLEFSLEYRREHPFIGIAGQVLGMTAEELDTLWLWAKTL